MILDRRVMTSAQWLYRSLVLAGLWYGPSALAATLDEIRVPGEIPGAALHAEGAQIYECQSDAANKLVWQPREPAATLLDAGISVGRHYAALHWETVDADTLVWEHKDGSSVKAKTVARIDGRAGDDLPWLKFKVIAQTGNGMFYGVTHVQRINTQGGLVQGPCNQPGGYRSVPYSADYIFWRAE